MRRQTLFLLLVISFSKFSVAQQSPDPDTYAIVVGISNYRYIKPLTYADKDADLFAELLQSGVGGKMRKENLFLLKNDSANAGNFWSALHRISNKKLKKGDRVFIFFAGHGDAVKGLNEYYLLLSDCQAGNDGNNYHLSMAAIDMYHLKNRIGTLTRQGVEVILILDACRTNELAGGYASQVFTNSIVQTKVGEIAMLATGPGQVSIEDASFGTGHGLFTYNLIDALSGRADTEGMGNKDKTITLAEINKWVTSSVGTMSEKFRVKQNPVFCCDDKQSTTIGFVNDKFQSAWNLAKAVNGGTEWPSNVRAARAGAGPVDTVLIALYNRFNNARKENNLWGDSSANSFYDEMEQRFPNDSITEEARYNLAADFINFAQQKINLYLEGKDALSIERLGEKVDSSKMGSFLSEEYDKMQKAVTEKWTIAGRMVEKAGRLLSTKTDSTVYYQLKPRMLFLLARGFINGEKETRLKFKDALNYSLESYKADSTAAYTVECLALMHSYKNSMNRMIGLDIEFELGMMYGRSDTAMRYFQKAISLAPKWVNPYRGIALKIYGEAQHLKALPYLHYALKLNPEDATTHMMIGDMYRQVQKDSALIYYRQALSLSGSSGHASIYRKMARVFLLPGHQRNNPAFKPDSVLYYSNLALTSETGKDPEKGKRNSMYKDVYLDIADAYDKQELPDFAMPYYHKVLEIAPDQFWANRAVINDHHQKNNVDSVKIYSYRYLDIVPNNDIATMSLARLYDEKLHNADSAIYYYMRNLPNNKMKDFPRERLGFLFMSKDKSDPRSFEFFAENSKDLPSGWRPYYNLACYYANNGNAEKAVEYLKKAVQLGLKNKQQILSEPYFKAIKEHDGFKKVIKDL